MARGKSAVKSVINIGDADRADALRRASSTIIKAQADIDEARAPVKTAMGAVKAAGIDAKVFKLFHGIRHLESDDQRVKALRQVDVVREALLGDVETSDLFKSGAKAALPPDTAAALRDASDQMADDEPPFDLGDEPAEIEASNDEGGDGSAVVEPPAAEADFEGAARDEGEVPEDAGWAFNTGRVAGRAGQDTNIFDPDTPSWELWNKGYAKGAAEREAAAHRFSIEERDDGLDLRDTTSGDDVLTLGFGAGDEADALADALNTANAAVDMSDVEIVAGIRDIMVNADGVSWVWCTRWQGVADGGDIPTQTDGEGSTLDDERRLTPSGVDVTDVVLPTPPKRGKPSATTLAEAERVGREYHALGADRDSDQPEFFTPLMVQAYRDGWDEAEKAAKANDESVVDAEIEVIPRLVVRDGTRGPVVFDTLADRPLIDCGTSAAGEAWIAEITEERGESLDGTPSAVLREALVELAKAGSPRPRSITPPPVAGDAAGLAAAV